MQRIGLRILIFLFCSISMGHSQSLDTKKQRALASLDADNKSTNLTIRPNTIDSSIERSTQRLELVGSMSKANKNNGFDAQIEQILQLISDGKLHPAKQELKKLRTDSAEKEDKQKLAQVELIDAYLYESTGVYPSAITAYNRAIALYKRTENPNGLIQAYLSKGNLLYKLSRFPEAEQAYKAALDLAQSIGNQKMENSLINNLAIVLSEKGNYYEAIQYLEHQLQHHATPRTRSDSISKSVTINNIGTIYKKLEDFEQGEKHFRHALLLLKDTGASKHRCVVYENLGDVYLGKDENKKGATHFNLALATAKKLNDPYEIGYALNKVGEADLRLQKTDLALAHYEEALAIFKDLELAQEAYISELGLAKVYEQRADLQKALEFAERVQAWVEENAPQPKLELESSKILSSIHEKQGDFESAHHFFKRYTALSSQRQQPDMLRQVFSYQMTEEYNRKEREAEIERDVKAGYQRNILFLIFAAVGFLILILRDRYRIIARKNELITAQSQELKELNETKDKLFAIIGHDLRGPIGSLEMVLDMLISDGLNREEFVDMAKNLKQNTHSIHQMLENLLQWANAQMKGQLEAQPTLVNVRAQIAEVTEFLQSLALEKQIQIENRTPSDLNVKADPNHLNLILRNLIGNAIKFTEQEGSIKIDGEEQASQAKISVEDTGVGMDDTQLNELFDKTKTGSTWGTAGEKGVGLGLSLCKEMVEENGGEIWVESKPGKGSTFHFSLPKEEEQKT